MGANVVYDISAMQRRQALRNQSVGESLIDIFQ